MLTIRSPPLSILKSTPRSLQSTHINRLINHSRKTTMIIREFRDVSMKKSETFWKKRVGLHKMRAVVDENSFSGSDDSGLNSPSYAAQDFYRCLNDKDVKGLIKLLAQDCVVEDSAFHIPFQGVKNVERFLRDLMTAMGKNVKFSIERCLEGNGSIAVVIWHLEWKKKTIPFTRGCTFFQCEKINEKITIKKVHVVVESPIKPGRVALELLKFTSAVFDRFPQVANGLLQEPYVLQNMMKIYKVFFGPFLHPLLFYYARVWSICFGILSRAFDMLLKVLGISL